VKTVPTLVFFFVLLYIFRTIQGEVSKRLHKQES
jgi:hypothetical protein